MKVAWKIALYNLVFHELPLIQHCCIFYKKNPFQSTKYFRRIQWQNMLRMHLLQSRISKFYVPPHLRLWHSTLPLLYKLRLLLQIFLRSLGYIDCVIFTFWRKKDLLGDMKNTVLKLSELLCIFFHVPLSPISLSTITKNYIIGICCFSTKHTALCKSKDWLARNQNNVSEWSDMSIRGLLFQWASTIKIQLNVLV